MDLVLANARLRPQMCGLDGSFSDYVAFLVGYDTGLKGSLLNGFSEWLAGKFGGEGKTLSWPYLVLRDSGLSEWNVCNWHELTPEDDARAVNALFQALESFTERG